MGLNAKKRMDFAHAKRDRLNSPENRRARYEKVYLCQSGPTWHLQVRTNKTIQNCRPITRTTHRVSCENLQTELLKSSNFFLDLECERIRSCSQQVDEGAGINHKLTSNNHPSFSTHVLTLQLTIAIVQLSSSPTYSHEASLSSGPHLR